MIEVVAFEFLTGPQAQQAHVVSYLPGKMDASLLRRCVMSINRVRFQKGLSMTFAQASGVSN